jgi:hypothetical protein
MVKSNPATRTLLMTRNNVRGRAFVLRAPKSDRLSLSLYTCERLDTLY